MKNLRGKSVFITGGGAGLGLAIARRFVAEGSDVMIADRDPRAAEVAKVNGAHFVLMEVTDPASVEAAVNTCVEKRSRLDVMVNNAGVEAPRMALHQYNLSDWQRVIDVDLNGVFYCMRHGLAQMVLQGDGGSIINLSSIAGLVGVREVAPYAAAKAAVANLTRSAAIEYGPRRIRVNAVAPTVTLTPMVERIIANDADPAARSAFYHSYNPLIGMPIPEDIASAVAFLASDDARFISGVVLPVDGGFTAK